MGKTRRKLPKGISLRKDGRYQGRFTFAGKRYTLYDKDLSALEKKLLDTKYELEHGIYGDGSNITLNHWFKIWLEEYKVIIVKNSTVMLYSSNYERYVKPALGEKKLLEIRTIHIQKLYHGMRARGLSQGTIQIVNAILSNLFTQAQINDLVRKNPCKGAVLPKEEKKEPRVMDFHEQQLFLKAIRDNYYQPICLMALATGLRIGELVGLTWEDVDLRENVLYVNRTLLYQKDYLTGEYNFRYQSPKSESSQRVIPLIPEAISMLEEHCRYQREFRKQRGCAWKPLKGMGNLIFTTRNGTPVQEVYLFKALEKITSRMIALEEEMAAEEKRSPREIKRITPHTLRHTFATRAFENGLAPKTVQEILGHSNLSITMDLYTHVSDDLKKQEMNKMNQVLHIL